MAENTFDGLEPGHVNVGRSAVRSLHATTANVEQSAVQRLTAETLHAENSALGVVNGSTIEIKESVAGAVAGHYVRVEDANVFFLIAPRVSGNVRAVLTLQAAFAFGAGYFVARQVASRLFGRSGRD
jgi:hypothetical protein